MDLLFIEKINPIIPSIGHMKIVLIPIGLICVKLLNIFVGTKYEIIYMINPIKNMYKPILLFLFSLLLFNIVHLQVINCNLLCNLNDRLDF